MLSRIMLLLAASLLLLQTGCFAATTPDYRAILRSETQWLGEQQLTSGALVMNKKAPSVWQGKTCYKIEPYFANLALNGLLENPSATTLNVVKNWIAWYFAHLNNPDYNGVKGSVYVYYANTSSGEEYPSNTYDSTDSYAATFLSLLRKYYDRGGDAQYLRDNKANIELVASAMLATFGSDGLTDAKPDYRIKYLMDNCEVYEGLGDIQYLEQKLFSDSKQASFYGTKKNASLKGINSLWNSKAGNYYSYKGSSAAKWATFYPDATCQLFPIWTGVIEPSSDRAKALWQQFNVSFPGWPQLNKPDDFPWAIICYTAALMNDKTGADAFLNSVSTKYINAGHPWLWYDMEAGFTMRAAALFGGASRTTRTNGKIKLHR